MVKIDLVVPSPFIFFTIDSRLELEIVIPEMSVTVEIGLNRLLMAAKYSAEIYWKNLKKFLIFLPVKVSSLFLLDPFFYKYLHHLDFS